MGPSSLSLTPSIDPTHTSQYILFDSGGTQEARKRVTKSERWYKIAKGAVEHDEEKLYAISEEYLGGRKERGGQIKVYDQKEWGRVSGDQDEGPKGDNIAILTTWW